MLLSPDLLTRIRERAAGYDRENSFSTEDFAELKEAGYLKALVPESFGGLGMSVEEVTREQMALAGAARPPPWQ